MNTTELEKELGFSPIVFSSKEEQLNKHPFKEGIIKFCESLNKLTYEEIQDVFSLMNYYINTNGKVILMHEKTALQNV